MLYDRNTKKFFFHKFHFIDHPENILQPKIQRFEKSANRVFHLESRSN